jgi:hypothetical protein
LYSYGEIDRERQRELERRNQTAQTVGKLYQRLADLEIARRTRALAVSIEARSGRRVAAGVADTGEQIAAIKAVADAETSVISANADLIAARLTLIGMCRSRHDVDALLDRLGVPK